MRWRGNRESTNVEDQRGMQSPASAGMGGGILLLRLLPLVFRVLGVKGTILVGVGLLAYGYFSGNLDQFLHGNALQGNQTTASTKTVQQSAQEKELVKFVSVVLADTEDTWHDLFRKMGRQYSDPKLVLFRHAIRSGCGIGTAQMGPFYCSIDHKVYLDLSFYDELKHRFGAPGDFAQAYVVAHEIGHHVQSLLGISAKVQQARQSQNAVQGNKLSVRLELQADCFAGIWAHNANQSRHILESGDVEEALAAASAIGDDRLQKQAKGYVTPDSFTHGTSAQRVKWFKIGLEQGTLKSCNTFSTSSL